MMTAGWVAPVTRGRAITRRLVGGSGARDLAAQPSWESARAELARTIYGAQLPLDAGRQAAHRAAGAATLWQLRVMAGWLPPGASPLARVFAAPMEIANIESHLLGLPDHPRPPAYRLGSLAVAWPAVARTDSTDDVRRVLVRSVWGDPGGVAPEEVALALHVALARRFVNRVPAALAWARGAVAVLAARERLAFGRDINDVTARNIDRLIGAHWREAGEVGEMAAALAPSAAWPFADVSDDDSLWRAELAVVARIGRDATTMAASSRYDERTATGLLTLLLVDLWRVRAAIEVAGRAPIPGEVFDAVA